MELNEIVAYGRSRAGEHADEEARKLREDFEQATLKLLGLESEQREAPEAEELDKSTSRLTREIAVLSPTCIEALKAKISSALYWVESADVEPWRDLASPYLDTLTTHDILLSFGEVFAGDYKRRLEEVRAKNGANLRREHLAFCASEAASGVNSVPLADQVPACAMRSAARCS
jgi:hypothetical protein